ncbi:MAG: hypothetical protein ACKOTA_10180, partial [Solirubrobacterales bacterium]
IEPAALEPAWVVTRVALISRRSRSPSVPPGGATVKVEKREEEAAPEQSSANYVAVRADERSGYEPYMLGVALLAALAGVALFRGGRRRDPELALTRTTFDDPRSRTYRR